MDTWEDFSNFMENTAFEDYDEVVIDTIPPKQLITKEEALNFFAQAAAIAIEKDYMSDGIDSLVWPYIADEDDPEYEQRISDKVWDEILLYFREIFGCEYHECY